MIQSLIIITILIVIIFLIYDICKSNNKVIRAKNTKSNKLNNNTSQKDKNVINNILVKNFLNDEYFVGGGMCTNNVGLRARLYNNFKPDKQNMHNIKKHI